MTVSGHDQATFHKQRGSMGMLPGVIAVKCCRLPNGRGGKCLLESQFAPVMWDWGGVPHLYTTPFTFCSLKTVGCPFSVGPIVLEKVQYARCFEPGAFSASGEHSIKSQCLPYCSSHPQSRIPLLLSVLESHKHWGLLYLTDNDRIFFLAYSLYADSWNPYHLSLHSFLYDWMPSLLSTLLLPTGLELALKLCWLALPPVREFKLLGVHFSLQYWAAAWLHHKCQVLIRMRNWMFLSMHYNYSWLGTYNYFRCVPSSTQCNVHTGHSP